MSASRLAPEWEPQDAIVLVWPHRHSDWAPTLKRIEPVYLELCKYIGRHQAIILIAYDDAHVLEVQDKLDTAGIGCKRMSFAAIPTNDTWIRDYGPVCTGSGLQKLLLDFRFDGWGQQYRWQLDDAVNARLGSDLQIKAAYRRVDQVLEAGNIEMNTRGVLLSSRTCFGRGDSLPDAGFAMLKRQIEGWLGCSQIHWLDDVRLAGDDTGGHVDTLARFCADGIIAYSACQNQRDPNHAALARLSVQLGKINRQGDSQYELVPLPLPDPLSLCGRQLPATYTNFLVTNHQVLVPVFHDRQDDFALRLLDELFPDREIIDIESHALISQRGGLHCAAMQIPEGFLL